MLETILKSIIALFRGTMAPFELDATLDKLDHKNPEHVDWRHSIEDLLKLLKLDSSFAARRKLWLDLSNTADYSGTAEQNMILHRQVMEKVASHGIVVPS